MRWRWPPENSCGYLPKAPTRPGRPCASSARARCSRSAWSAPMPWMVIGSTSVWPIVKRGFSDAYGFWNTIWMRRRIAWRSRSLSVSRLRPSNSTSPRGRLVQPQQRQPHRRLARARFADHAQRVAAAQLEVDALHGLELALAEQPFAQEEALGQRAHLAAPPARCGSLGLAGRARRRCRRCDRRSPAAARRCCRQARPAGQQRLGVGVLRRLRRCAPPGPARAPRPGASPPRGRRSRPPGRGRG